MKKISLCALIRRVFKSRMHGPRLLADDAVEPVVTDDPTIAHCSFIHVVESSRKCVACVVVSSEIGAECTESSGVVMGSTGRSHPTLSDQPIISKSSTKVAFT